MRRRAFMAGLAGAAWTPSALAQQSTKPAVGLLVGGLAGQLDDRAGAVRKGLSDVGFVEGRNVTIEVRWTNRNDQLAALAAELVRLPVDLIFATGNANAALAAMSATKTIPIVFSNGSDPVKAGLVASMNRPGGNVTGFSYYTGALNAKRLEMLREIVPQSGPFGFLTNPTNLVSRSSVPDIEDSARTIGQSMVVIHASTPDGIDRAFASAVQQNVKALLVDVDAFFAGRHEHIVSLAARHEIPACYANRVFPMAGGLMSYADDRLESIRQAAVYAGRILKGEKPGELPVQTPTKFELVINLKTAKTLGLTVPNTLLIRASEVID